MIFQAQILPNMQYDPVKVQGAFDTILYVIAGAIILIMIGVVIYKIFQNMTYKTRVLVHQLIGTVPYLYEDRVKKVMQPDGKYMFHYKGLNKKSDVFSDRFMRILKKRWMLFFSKSFICFEVFYKDGAIFPMEINKAYEIKGDKYVISEVSLSGLDYDKFNILLSETQRIQNKYKTNDRFLQLLPYVAFLVLIVAFVVGMMLYTKHVEALSKDILGFAQANSDKVIDKLGSIQVIPSK